MTGGCLTLFVLNARRKTEKKTAAGLPAAVIMCAQSKWMLPLLVWTSQIPPEALSGTRTEPLVALAL